MNIVHANWNGLFSSMGMATVVARSLEFFILVSDSSKQTTLSSVPKQQFDNYFMIVPLCTSFSIYQFFLVSVFLGKIHQIFLQAPFTQTTIYFTYEFFLKQNSKICTYIFIAIWQLYTWLNGGYLIFSFLVIKNMILKITLSRIPPSLSIFISSCFLPLCLIVIQVCVTYTICV